MSRRGRFFLAGSGLLLLALAGCGHGFWNMGERAAWRHDSEIACMKSGAVTLGAGTVQIDPIEGPGMCGIDFPLRVSVLGEPVAMSYGDDLRPPAAIPGGASAMPPWPVRDQPYSSAGAPVAPVQRAPVQPVQGDVQPRPGETLRWVPGPPGIVREPDGAVQQPVRLDPPAQAGGGRTDDIPDDAILPQGQQPPLRAPSAYGAPGNAPQNLPSRTVPSRAPLAGGPALPATLTPTATLACPLVSALDRWVSEGVQPAAEHWFGTQVVTIKQISAYSCREMIGAGGSGISEHAFGNAIDIAAFTFADGRTVTVQNGWHGSPQEQGFLHDVQLYACETFTTVLAPGYNAAHYNHIHVDLMRRESGRRPCRPDAIPGEVAAAKARASYAVRHNPAYTGSIAAAVKGALVAPGADGYVSESEANRDEKPVEQPVYLGRAPKLPGEDRMTRVY